MSMDRGVLGLGAWRLFLAALVMFSHLWAHMLHGPAAYAVWGFFSLSGFLMVDILTEKYGVTLRGVCHYAFNRVLRIFPGYYVALALGVVTLVFAAAHGINLTAVNGEFVLPSGINWLNPLTLLSFLPRNGLPVSVSNALAIEVTAYLLMPLLAISPAAAWLALILSFGANVALGFGAETFTIRYATFMPCFMAFAAGGLACHYRDQLSRFSAPVLSVTIWCVHCLIWFRFPYWPWTYGLYTSLLLSTWVVVSLFKLRTSKSDAWAGDLSYPVYLFHELVAGWFLLLGWFNRDALATAFGIAAITVLLSFFVVFFVEMPLRKFKFRAPPKQSTQELRPLQIAAE